MAKDMKALGMPDAAIVIGKPSDGPIGPQYPSIYLRTSEDLNLPEGDFFFLGIGHVRKREESEEDDGTKCFYNTMELHAIQPISKISDEANVTDKAGNFEEDFDKAEKEMLSLKEQEGDDDESDDSDDEENEEEDDDEEY